jgi:5-formyltetrahydrofolate cyclo-ligase
MGCLDVDTGSKFNSEMIRFLSPQKDPLRRLLLEQRERLAGESRLAAEKRIADTLSQQAVLQGWSRVAVFLPWRGEPDLMATWRAWHARGIALALPVVVSRDAPLVMQAWTPGAPLIQDAMGLRAPADSQTLVCDTWIVPCVGVDPSGGRLGAGKGFYDRTIAVTPSPRPRLIGVCFDHARQTQSFAEPHDMRLDACVTETGITRFNQ